jgi:hypothetical protein
VGPGVAVVTRRGGGARPAPRMGLGVGPGAVTGLLAHPIILVASSSG